MLKKWVALTTLAVALLFAWSATSDNTPSFGDPLSGLNSEELDQFFLGEGQFKLNVPVSGGLGPVFNGRSCGGCHSNPVAGGDSGTIQHRFATVTNGQFDPLTQLGGPIIQTLGIGHVGLCNFVGETIPPQATIVAERKTSPLFGLGLVDNVPDKVLQKIATHQQKKYPTTAGRPNMVTDVTTGLTAVGKFGWKAQAPSLLHFSAEAYLNEMGVTSPFFPSEQCPQGDCASVAACDPVPDPEDNGSNVQAFADFMTFLAAPPRGSQTSQARAGEWVFRRIGCAECHLPTLRTGPNPIQALRHVTFHPFSDFLLHDMGSLGDGIEQGEATGSEMRTAPLWGLRMRRSYLHDGSESTLEGAILAHDGQGAEAGNRFAALTPIDMQNLFAFLNSL
jgi:CxxC motif-containing protein (DUF1111 family)